MSNWYTSILQMIVEQVGNSHTSYKAKKNVKEITYHAQKYKSFGTNRKKHGNVLMTSQNGPNQPKQTTSIAYAYILSAIKSPKKIFIYSKHCLCR